MDEAAQTVYLICPRLGGLANDVEVRTEAGEALYHVKSEPLSLLGRRYTVYDGAMQEVLTSQQDHTVLFPRHTVLENGRPFAKVGQHGVIPQDYFVQIGTAPPAIVRIPLYGGVFKLQGPHGVVAEIAQHRSTWVVVTGADPEHSRIAALIALIYREYAIGG